MGQGVRGDAHKYLQAYQNYLRISRAENHKILILRDQAQKKIEIFFVNTKSNYPLSYRVPVRERYGSTLLPATREQHDQNRTQSH